MGEARSGARVRATRLSARAWGVVLDAGRRADVPSEAWAELAARGMAKGDRLAPTWQQVAAALGTAPTVEVLARHGALRHQTRITLLGRVAVMATRRIHAGDEGVTGEPLVLVQVVPPDEVVPALLPHLPPVADLRADDGAMGRSPVVVPLVDLGLDEPGPRGPWLTTEELRTDPTRESVRPARAEAEGVAAALDDVPEDHDLDDGEVVGLLSAVPGLDPRLVALAASAETEVTVTLAPGRPRPTSGEDVLALFGGLALRHWVVTEHGLVCVRADRGGFDVLGVAPGDLVRAIRCLVAGDLPDPLDVADAFGGSA